MIAARDEVATLRGAAAEAELARQSEKERAERLEARVARLEAVLGAEAARACAAPAPAATHATAVDETGPQYPADLKRMSAAAPLREYKGASKLSEGGAATFVMKAAAILVGALVGVVEARVT